MKQTKTLPVTEAEANAISILRIPDDQLPDAQARAELVRRALAGQDVYAYTPHMSEQWVVWVRQRFADEESRYRPMIWAWSWRCGDQPEAEVQP